MEKRGFELAVSTLIIILLGVILLIAIVIFVTGGFDKFKRTTNPLGDSSTTSAILQACRLACENNDKFFYCCKDNELDDEGNTIKCTDKRLELECGKFSCEGYSC